MYCLDSSKIKEMKDSGYFLQRTLYRKLSDRLHSHTFYELIYVVSGSCVHECNEKNDALSTGDLVFIVPQITHRFTSQSDDCDVIALSVIGEEMQKFMFLFNEKSDICYCFKIKLSMEQRSVFMLLYDKIINGKSITGTNAERAILNQLLLFLFCVTPTQKSSMPSSLSYAIEQIQKPKNIAFGVKVFMELSGYSHSQLCRLMKKYYNVTPTEYINHIKMNYAYRLILDTHFDYETICEKVGFESFSYFCKLFKKHFGCSVAALRKEDYYIAKTI